MKRRNLLTLAAAATLLPVLALPLAQPAHAADSLEKVKQSGVLRIGVTPAEPWFFKDPLTENWTGVAVSYGQQIAEDLGVKLQPVETTWANSVAAIQAGQIDIMFVLDPTEERRKAADFPDADLLYYALGALVKEGSDARTWQDLDKPDLTIGVTLGTSIDRTLTERLKSAKIERFTNNDEAIAAFAAGRVDAVSQFHPALTAQFARLKLGKLILPEPVQPVSTSAGIARSEDGAFREWLAERFRTYYAEGKPQAWFEAYLESRDIDPATIPGVTKESWN